MGLEGVGVDVYDGRKNLIPFSAISSTTTGKGSLQKVRCVSADSALKSYLKHLYKV